MTNREKKEITQLNICQLENPKKAFCEIGPKAFYHYDIVFSYLYDEHKKPYVTIFSIKKIGSSYVIIFNKMNVIDFCHFMKNLFSLIKEQNKND